MKITPPNKISLILLAASTPVFAQTTITPMDSAEALAQSLVGPGIQISNVQYTGSNGASGYFSGGYAAGNDIGSGVILTSGLASSAGANSNTSESTSTNLRAAGDSTLNTLIPGYSTYDATVLSFDFVSSGDSAYFNYAFASEEYVEWVGSSFNDVFGFFVNGENVALLPGTDTAVSINTVSNVNNADLFNDNSIGNGAPYAFEYDGFTDVFTAEITGLEAGQSYNIMMGIADAGDNYYDSAVFIQAGSFSQSIVAVAPSGAPEPKAMFMVLIAVAGMLYKSRSVLRQA
ncbi:choice-of-anchor L domain-containing protein [Rubritalea marina]|uniref:choice-of-anchor L domain-containing protein n=1 Tax=Rubritalea marina TaxID=361055 RepID=UPI000475B5AE|nr:choice-of-anchor L domain-containing protein [Rubritalea marina]